MCVCAHVLSLMPSVRRFQGQAKLCQQTVTQAHFLPKSSVPLPSMYFQELFHAMKTEGNAEWLPLLRIVQCSSQHSLKFHPRCHAVSAGLTATCAEPRTRAQMEPCARHGLNVKVTCNEDAPPPPGPCPCSYRGPDSLSPKVHLLDLKAKGAVLSPPWPLLSLRGSKGGPGSSWARGQDCWR